MRWAVLSLALIAASAQAEPPLADQIKQLQADDARLQTIGFRLTTANAALCRDVQPVTGLLLTDMRNYARPAAIRAALGLTGDFAVQAAARGSPAASIGLVPGAEVLSVEGETLAALPAASANDTKRLGGVQDRIDAALAVRGAVQLGLRDSAVTVRGVPACRSRFELVTKGQGALAESRLIQVSRAILGKVPSDDEAAFLIAHELAHIILRHRARLAALGRRTASIRETEREADRLAPWLMANAGYDAAQSPESLRRWGVKGLAGLLQEPSHDRTQTRARMVALELAVIQQTATDATGRRDWRSRFNMAMTLP